MVFLDLLKCNPGRHRFHSFGSCIHSLGCTAPYAQSVTKREVGLVWFSLYLLKCNPGTHKFHSFGSFIHPFDHHSCIYSNHYAFIRFIHSDLHSFGSFIHWDYHSFVQLIHLFGSSFLHSFIYSLWSNTLYPPGKTACLLGPHWVALHGLCSLVVKNALHSHRQMHT